MKVKVTKANEYVADIKIVDIDAASEEDAKLFAPVIGWNHPYLHRSLVKKGPYRGFFVIALLTFTSSELPVGRMFSIPENSQGWKVIAENKAARHIRFSPDEYEEDEVKLKAKLRAWAEKNGIKFETR